MCSYSYGNGLDVPKKSGKIILKHVDPDSVLEEIGGLILAGPVVSHLQNMLRTADVPKGFAIPNFALAEKPVLLHSQNGQYDYCMVLHMADSYGAGKEAQLFDKFLIGPNITEEKKEALKEVGEKVANFHILGMLNTGERILPPISCVGYKYGMW